MSARIRLLRRLLIAGVVLLLSPFAVFFLVRGSLALANALLERRYPPPGRMISVGDHRLHLFCQGTGSPTVVIEPGLGVDWVSWRPVVDGLARSREVCVYDRAGYGWSEAGPMPRTAEQSATELHELMTRSRHDGPIVLVAHSFGGHVARVYAGRFPDALAGLVLVDPSEADRAEFAGPAVTAPSPARPWTLRGLIDRLPPLGWERIKRLYHGDDGLPLAVRKLPAGFRHRVVVASSLDQLAAEQSELDSRRPSQAQAWAAVPSRRLPLTVITPLYPDRADLPSAAAESAARRERHRAIADVSALGAQIFAERSGHMVHIDQPELVTNAVRDLVSRLDGGAR